MAASSSGNQKVVPDSDPSHSATKAEFIITESVKILKDGYKISNQKSLLFFLMNFFLFD